jgi:putative peptidoglycan lipid II flippase
MLKILKKKNTVFYVILLLLLTKVLGFLKLRTIAQLFGVSHELDIFWAAFTIPDMLFMVLVAGSINAAVIPIFSDILHKDGKENLNKFFNHLTLIIAWFCTLIALLFFIFTPQLTTFLIESSFSENILNYAGRITEADYDLFVRLTRIMLISPVLLGISSLITGYLQVRKQFFVTSLAPLFYNLAMIVGSVVLVVFFNMGVEGIAISVITGSLLHLLVQLPKLKEFYDERFKVDKNTFVEAFNSTQAKLALKLAIPRTIGILGEQINVVFNTLISFSLAAGALSAYKFAFSLHMFPINIIGSAVAQVALPDLAENCDDQKKFCNVLNRSIQISLFLIFPIVAILIVLRLPLVRLAYGTGAFDWRATILTAWCLVLLSFSVLGQTVVQILLRAFYALKETWLPLIAITVGIVVNILLAFLFTNFFSHYYDWRPILEQMFLQIAEANGTEFLNVLRSFFTDVVRWSTQRGDSDMAVGGLSLSLSIAYVVEMVLLSFLLNSKKKILTWKESLFPTIKKLLNTGLMCIGMYFVFKLFDFQLDTTRTISIVVLTIITTLYGLISYWLGCKVFGIREIEIVDNVLDDIKDNFLKKKDVDETL